MKNTVLGSLITGLDLYDSVSLEYAIHRRLCMVDVPSIETFNKVLDS